MNLKSLNLKWALAFAAAAAVGVVGVVLVLTLVGNGNEQAIAQPAESPLPTMSPAPMGTPEATDTLITPRPIKPELPSFPVVVPTLPKGLVTGEKRPCPEGWGRISDDMAVYSICVPPGWGIPDPDLATGEPVANAVLHYGEAYIFSPEAFPYPVGDEAKIGQKLGDPEADFVRVKLFPLTPDTTISGTCQAQLCATVADLPAAACEYRYDREVGSRVPNPQGSWCGRQIFVSLPLAKPPVWPSGEPVPIPTDKPYSAVLGIIVLGRCEVVERYRSTLSEMLSTLQVVP